MEWKLDLSRNEELLKNWCKNCEENQAIYEELCDDIMTSSNIFQNN